MSDCESCGIGSFQIHEDFCPWRNADWGNGAPHTAADVTRWRYDLMAHANELNHVADIITDRFLEDS